MDLRLKIFIRISGLVAGLIILVTWLVCTFAVKHHRSSTTDIFGAHLDVLSHRVEELVLLDDRVALQDLLRGTVRDHKEVEYAFVERAGRPFVHTFPEGVPRGLLELPPGSAGTSAAQLVLRKRGDLIVDLAKKVGEEEAVMHLGLSCTEINQQVLPQVLSIAGLGTSAVILGFVFAAVAARMITREVDETTSALRAEIIERERAQQGLAEYRDQLEELVAQRTRALEESQVKMRQAERLASVGTFAAGVAHEINNPLASILMSARHTLRSVQDPATVETIQQEIIEDADRCAHIVNGLLRFAGQKPSEKEALEINAVVSHAVDVTRKYAQSRGVRLDVVLESDLGPVTGNATELEQVFVNVIRNAVEASGEGMIVAAHSQPDGDGVLVRVKDCGRGMTPEERRRALDPFFTTRAADGGSGLGLSIVHGTVADHGGTVDIESEVGKGSVITVKLPQTAGLTSEKTS